MNKDYLQGEVLRAVEDHKQELWDLARFMYENPELGYREQQASKAVAEFLESAGFQVELGIGGLATALKACREGVGLGPHVAFLAEYDALPGIGHGCGHNWIAAAAVGAAVGMLPALDHVAGAIYVVGCPAEEGYVDNAGGKVALLESGCFQGIQAALLLHPAGETVLDSTANAREAVEISFHGRAAHASAAPHEGINALEALIQTFVALNGLRAQFPDEVRVHGVITKGGEAPNIVPHFASARFYVRAYHSGVLARAVESLKACARGAAMATGAQVEFRSFAYPYAAMRPNRTLVRCFSKNLGCLGIQADSQRQLGYGSTDLGNVSQVMPAIHPYLRITQENIPLHTRWFAQATVTDTGLRSLLTGAKALALTALDLLVDDDLWRSVQAEYAQKDYGPGISQ
ncbi:MAG: M20 family metallopeptidase [Bacillota bacterium]